jgi:hypothetical protein
MLRVLSGGISPGDMNIYNYRAHQGYIELPRKQNWDVIPSQNGLVCVYLDTHGDTHIYVCT